MSSIDQQFVEFIVKSLVGEPDKVSIERRIDEKGVLLELSVDPDDLGRVIGKRGATAQSIRTLLRALGTKNEARYNLKIIDTAESADNNTSEDSDASSDDNSGDADAVSDTEDKDHQGAVTESETEQDEDSDSLKKAKKELEEFDDLDI